MCVRECVCVRVRAFSCIFYVQDSNTNKASIRQYGLKLSSLCRTALKFLLATNLMNMPMMV